MAFLYNTSICCMLLSIWAVIQLGLMGLFYKLEAVPLIEDAEEEHYDNYQQFLTETSKNYQILALNCWIVAGLYLVMLCISYGCFRKALKMARDEAIRNNDDEYYCNPPLSKKDIKKMKQQMQKRRF